jgi:tetratricopeptide (TPR) repeat protein
LLGHRTRARPIRTWSVVSSVLATLGLISLATANDSDAFRGLGMFGEWAADCRLPPGPTNQHIRFTPSDNGEVASFSHNGIKEFPGTIRSVKMISATRAGWRATANGITTDVVVERNGSRYRGLESVRTDGKTLVKDGFIIEQRFGSPWLEKCATPSAANISTQVMLDTYRDCSGKDRDRAIQRCTELIGMQPASPFAYYHRAIAYDTVGQHDKAVSDISEALKLDPQYAIAYNARA